MLLGRAGEVDGNAKQKIANHLSEGERETLATCTYGSVGWHGMLSHILYYLDDLLF